MNFDFEGVKPFLERLVPLVTSGFGSGEVASLLAKIEALEPDQRLQTVFPIAFHGGVCPLYVGVFMDDVDAPDICFSGPAELAQLIDGEMKKYDPTLEG
jgi:hypothetical protein